MKVKGDGAGHPLAGCGRIKNLRAVTMKGRMTGELRGVSEVQSMGVGAALLCGVTEEKD